MNSVLVVVIRCQSILTSAWLPEDNVFLHFSHLRHGLCQSFPKDVTFSAINKNTGNKFKTKKYNEKNNETWGMS
jgi:hypothetical protein